MGAHALCVVRGIRDRRRGESGEEDADARKTEFFKARDVGFFARGGERGRGGNGNTTQDNLTPSSSLPLSSAFISKVVSRERKNMGEEKRRKGIPGGDTKMSALSFAWCAILFFWTLCHDCDSVTYRYRIIALGAASKPFFPSPRVLGPLLRIPTPKRRRIHTHIAPRINGCRQPHITDCGRDRSRGAKKEFSSVLLASRSEEERRREGV